MKINFSGLDFAVGRIFSENFNLRNCFASLMLFRRLWNVPRVENLKVVEREMKILAKSKI